MGESKRESKREEALDLGLDPDEYRTKEDLQEAIDRKVADVRALGPREDAEGDDPDAPEPTGKARVGVQPVADEDIPDALR